MWRLAVAMAGAGLLAKHFYTANRNTLSNPAIIQSLDKSAPVNPGEEAEENFEISNSVSCSKTSGSRVVLNRKGKLIRKHEELNKGSAADPESNGNKMVFGGSKRLSLFKKKKKTFNKPATKRDLFCSHDTSLFGWGFCLGIVFTVENTEIRKLNEIVDQTKRVVQELKDEVYRRPKENRLDKFDENTTIKADGDFENLVDDVHAVISTSEVEECNTTSNVTEEIDPLEAEFEMELQKLSYCMVGMASRKGKIEYDSSKVVAGWRN